MLFDDLRHEFPLIHVSRRLPKRVASSIDANTIHEVSIEHIGVGGKETNETDERSRLQQFIDEIRAECWRARASRE